MSGPGLVLARVQGCGAPGPVWVKPSQILLNTVVAPPARIELATNGLGIRSNAQNKAANGLVAHDASKSPSGKNAGKVGIFALDGLPDGPHVSSDEPDRDELTRLSALLRGMTFSWDVNETTLAGLEASP